MLPLSEEDAKTLKEILSDLAELMGEGGDIPLDRPPARTQTEDAKAQAPDGE